MGDDERPLLSETMPCALAWWAMHGARGGREWLRAISGKYRMQLLNDQWCPAGTSPHQHLLLSSIPL